MDGSVLKWGNSHVLLKEMAVDIIDFFGTLNFINRSPSQPIAIINNSTYAKRMENEALSLFKTHPDHRSCCDNS
jgi:hypothetical protein